MDPDACLERILRAVHNSDTDDLRASANALADWIDKGGFVPDVTVYLPDVAEEL